MDKNTKQMIEGDVVVTMEVSVLMHGTGRNQREVVRSAENQLQAMDLDDVAKLAGTYQLAGYGVKHGSGEIRDTREVPAVKPSAETMEPIDVVIHDLKALAKAHMINARIHRDISMGEEPMEAFSRRWRMMSELDHARVCGRLAMYAMRAKKQAEA